MSKKQINLSSRVLSSDGGFGKLGKKEVETLGDARRSASLLYFHQRRVTSTHFHPTYWVKEEP